jgi:hypothetical protein
MIAIEIFFALVVLGLIGVYALQHLIKRKEQGHKGDAEKTEEEIRSHQRRV